MFIDSNEIREKLIRTKPIQVLYLCWTLISYVFFGKIVDNQFRAIASVLRFKRTMAAVGGYSQLTLIDSIITRWILYNREKGTNDIIPGYRATKESRDLVREFKAYGEHYLLTLKYPSKVEIPQRQGDLLILKPCTSQNEKGVIFVKYDSSFKKFISFYNIEALAKHYRFVLEPGFWGYQNTEILMYVGVGTDIIVEAQYKPDYTFIKDLQTNLIPINLGSGDWIDPELFQPDASDKKRYDLIMVASWVKFKRHRLLFESLSRLDGKVGKVALIGYPWEGRTLDDIKREAKEFNVLEKLDFFENIPPDRVNQLMRMSKVGLMLTKREGANKSIYECFFSNVPVIVSAENMGVNRDHINQYTGCVAEDRNLPQVIVSVLDRYAEFRPRQWARENTGYPNSTVKLNNLLKEIAIQKGEAWTRDIYPKKNCPEAMYAREADRLESENYLPHLRQFLRSN